MKTEQEHGLYHGEVLFACCCQFLFSVFERFKLVYS